MALDRSPEILRGPWPNFFFFVVAFREEFTRISLCPYSATSPHSLMPCLLTDQNYSVFEKGNPRNISMKLFLSLTSGLREE